MSRSIRAAASRPAIATTHADPTFVVDGIVHYCVANMPGAVARTSTYALNNVTLPHALRIADLGWKESAAGQSAPAPG
jgi:alanine dehydrogenase